MKNVLKPVDFQVSDADLHKVLLQIDGELRASGTKLFGRELRGWLMFCRKFHLEMASFDPLAVRIFDWFTKQYGDRLKGNLDFGATVVELRHDFYSLRLPRIFGGEIVHCDPLLVSHNFGPRVTRNGVAVKTNLFENLQGLTSDFIKSLTDDECQGLLEAYSRGVLGFSRMGDVQGTPALQGAPYSKEALDDLHQSAAQLVGHRPNYGFSRWASLQATEKLLKSFITQKGQTFKKTHDLTSIATIAVSAGLPAPSPRLLQDIQCAPEVRYSSATIGKSEALRSHYAALELCAQIAPQLEPQSGWITEIRMLSYELDGRTRPMKALRVVRGKVV